MATAGGRPEGKRPLGRRKRSWEDTIEINLQEVECGDIDWFGVARDRGMWRAFVIMVVNIWVP
jgi:hypothetical protein